MSSQTDARVVSALTVAGSDSGGGAGLQADLKTFAAHGVFGASAVTAVTAQDTSTVHAVHPVPPGVVVAQIDAVLDDLRVQAMKTGMLGGADVVGAVARLLAARRSAGGERVPLVVDPVMVAKGGAPLLAPEAAAAVRDELLPLAALVTPNLPEAAVLLGEDPGEAPDWTEPRREHVARRLLELGPAAVLLKGGHARDAHRGTADLFADAEGSWWIRSAWVDTRATHGTGCALSAAITARLARGEPLDAAVADSVAWLGAALRRGLHPGRGLGSPGHLDVRPA